MTSTVADRLLLLRQKTTGLAQTPTLLRIDPSVIANLEARSSSDSYIGRTLDEIERCVSRLGRNIEDTQALLDLKDKYVELRLFEQLKSLEPSTEAVPRRSTPTPDFVVTLDDGPLYVELKALNIVDGTSHQKRTLESSLEANIELEAQVKAGRKAAMVEQVHQPYHSSEPQVAYDHSSVSLVIETLIAKITNNLSREQFSLGDTILAVDLGELGLCSAPADALQETYEDPDTRAGVSGELWHVAFGTIGQAICKPVDFRGEDNTDGHLSRNGVLRDHPWVKGLLVLCGDDDWYGILDRNSPRGATEVFLRRIVKELCLGH